MSERTPQKGDLIRVSYEATVDEVMDDGRVYVADASGNAWVAFVPPPATVEVVERADEPNDPMGTIRTEAPDGLLWVKCGNGDWTCLSVCVDDEDDDYVSGFPITGAVPGTPAAEAQRQQQPDELPEWERELLEAQVDPHKPHVLVRAETSPHGWEPRVWHSEGVEPPASVTAVQWLDVTEGKSPWLRRVDAGGWLWVDSLAEMTSDCGYSWWNATRGNHGRYREVPS